MKKQPKKIRYAVVGLGHIAQAAVLPAFKNAGVNSELVALVSGDPVKLKKLGSRYKAKYLLNYYEYSQALQGDLFDAVYIALPNSLHETFMIEAAEQGKHVLCEKPLSTTSMGCQEMIEVASDNNIKLMTAYRLHFERCNMDVASLIQKGKIGDPKLFTSSFSYQIKPHNSRLQAQLGGGVLYDIGIYCINAARYLFRDEPWKVSAVISPAPDARFKEVDGTASVTLHFPKDRIAQFTCSFALDATSWYEVLGTKGSICVDSAYEYADGKECQITIKGKTTSKKYKKHDQFAPELIYFSNCILKNKDPEPSGVEGMADIRIIEALFKSASSGVAVELSPPQKNKYPSSKQVITRPAIHGEPEIVHAQGASS